MNETHEPAPDGMHKANDAPTTPSHDKPMSRRDFVGGIGKLIAIGALSHFSLLAGKAFAGTNDDGCSYGHPVNDGDKCEPKQGNADVCEDGSSNSDDCTPADKAEEDVCHTGQDPDDACKENGTNAEGDVCLGGGGTTNSHAQDTCVKGVGDECKPDGGTWWGGGHDKCKEDTGNTDDADKCTKFNDDTCYNGTNGPNGGNDDCDPDWATDGCFDGSDTQDKCAEDQRRGGEDTCRGATTDDCRKVPNDPDECPGGKTAYDECPGGAGDKDECPSGAEADDICEPGCSRDSDDVPAGGSH